MALHKCCLQTLPGGAAQTPPCEGYAGSCHRLELDGKTTAGETQEAQEHLGADQVQGNLSSSPQKILQERGLTHNTLSHRNLCEIPQSSHHLPVNPSAFQSQLITSVWQRHKAPLISLNSSDIRGFFPPCEGN